jgi:hypothetical protein
MLRLERQALGITVSTPFRIGPADKLLSVFERPAFLLGRGEGWGLVAQLVRARA